MGFAVLVVACIEDVYVAATTNYTKTNLQFSHRAFARFARQDHFPETRGVSLVSIKDICFYTSTCRRLSLSAFVDEIAAGYYFELS